MNLQPVSSPYADLYVWKTVNSIASNLTANNANKVSSNFQILGDSFFCLMAFLGSTNYDQMSGEFTAVGINGGNPVLYGDPRIPNNFEVFIKYNGQINMMGAPVPQACICSNGYLEGRQLPYPLLFPPMSTFNFDFWNVAPTLYYQTQNTNLIPLVINFGLYGYNVPVENLSQFLQSWAAMQEIAAQGQPLWLKNFTAMSIPGLTVAPGN